MKCCPLQDMDNTFQSSLQLWLPAEQANKTSKHFTRQDYLHSGYKALKRKRGKDAGVWGWGQRMKQGAQDQDDAYMYETVKE